MFYIIGGAPRSGKSTIARRLLVEKQVAYFPMDALTTMFESDPSLGINHAMPILEKSEKVWRFAGWLADHLYTLGKDYLLEGDGFTPMRIHQFLQDRDASKIKVCFVGFTELSPQEKLKIIRENDQDENDWTKECSDEELLPMILEMIDLSKYLKAECEKYGFKFFDVSHDFLKVQDEIFNFLSR